jgi:hypothetical protein
MLLSIFLGGAGALYWTQIVEPRSATSTVLEWARLADVPAEARELTVGTRGNMFSREIELSFTASRQQIDEWLSRSPGIADARVVRDAGVLVYEITPAEGVSVARVTLNLQNGHVVVFAQWS